MLPCAISPTIYGTVSGDRIWLSGERRTRAEIPTRCPLWGPAPKVEAAGNFGRAGVRAAMRIPQDLSHESKEPRFS